MIDLSSNENPYPPSEKAVKAACAATEELNRYLGREEISSLAKAIAGYCGAGEEFIRIGPGTNYLFEKAVCRFAKGREVVLLNPTILRCADAASHIGGRILRMQLTPPGFEVEWDMEEETPRLILIDYPNSPTGQCLIEREQLIKLLKNRDNMVMVDEAAYEYCGKTFVDLVPEYPNLAVARTLDKAFGLAGMRVSWLVAGDDFQVAFDPFDVLISRPACAAATVALGDKEHALEGAARTVCERGRLECGLAGFGMEVFPSEANFLLVRTAIPDFALKLRTAGFFIEDLSFSWLSEFFRISVGSQEENDDLMKAIEAINNKNSY